MKIRRNICGIQSFIHVFRMICYGERSSSLAKLSKNNLFCFSWENTPKEFIRSIHHNRPSAVAMSFLKASPYLDLASTILHETQSGIPLFLIVEDSVTEAQGFAQLVSNPRVDFASTKAPPEELAQRLRVLLQAHSISKRERLPGSSDITSFLHHQESHRLDAKKIAQLFGFTVRQISSAIDVLPQTLQKTPDSQRLQNKLQLFERIARGLSLVDNSEDNFRRWLNAPNLELNNKPPKEIMLSGDIEVVANLVEDALLGQPS